MENYRKMYLFSGFSGQAERCLQVFRENQSRIVIHEEDERLVLVFYNY